MKKAWIMLMPHAGRWKSLYLTPGPRGLEPSDISQLQTIPSDGLKNLEEFILLIDTVSDQTIDWLLGGEELILRIFSCFAGATTLRSLTLCFLWNTSLARFPFAVERLSSLQLSLPKTSLHDVLDNLLQKCSQLRSLRLSILESWTSLQCDSIDVLPRLEILFLNCNGHWGALIERLNASCLVTLHLYVSQDEGQPVEQAYLPGASLLPLMQNSPHFLNLHFTDVCMEADHVLSCLRAAPKLKRLMFYPSNPAFEPHLATEALISALHMSCPVGLETLVPSLSEISLELRDQAAADQLVRTLESRRDNAKVGETGLEGPGLQRVELHFRPGIGLRQEEWARLHRLRENGLTLEITFEGPNSAGEPMGPFVLDMDPDDKQSDTEM